MGLKTLKDIEDVDCYIYFEGEETIRAIPEFRLKQEAIKWIKELMQFKDNKEYTKVWQEDGKIKKLDLHPRTLINWIKHFFNITEKDLK